MGAGPAGAADLAVARAVGAACAALPLCIGKVTCCEASLLLQLSDAGLGADKAIGGTSTDPQAHGLARGWHCSATRRAEAAQCAPGLRTALAGSLGAWERTWLDTTLALLGRRAPSGEGPTSGRLPPSCHTIDKHL